MARLRSQGFYLHLDAGLARARARRMCEEATLLRMEARFARDDSQSTRQRGMAHKLDGPTRSS